MNSFFYNLFDACHQALPILARGGGGGSGGGGGGGGGDGFLVLVGYLPAHYVTKWIMLRFGRRPALIGGIITAILVTGGTSVGLAKLGAGAGLSFWVLVQVAVGAGGGVYSGVTNFWSKLLKKASTSKSVMTYAAARDPVWHEAAIEARISQVFTDFQRDWSNFDYEHMRTYTSPRFYEHMYLMMWALYQMDRQNRVDNPAILKQMVIDAVDLPTDDHDGFTAYITARADDKLVTRSQNTQIYEDKSTFSEFWRFDRQGDDWVLDSITQATEDPLQTIGTMQAFAESHGMYYSPDMGWLLLPQRGVLFGGANFKRSDINNHIIGNWNGKLVQLYTYIPFKSKSQQTNYIVGQMTLPKSYGGIIVKRRAKRLSWSSDLSTNLNLPGISRWWRSSGYQKVRMEWPDFNKQYVVMATDMDKVTSFELLNPSFMAYLYDSGLEISIEVAGNVVYFYAPAASSYTQDYGVMLQILWQAHKELER